MTAAWLVYVLGVGTLLTIGAELLSAALRQMGRSTRFVYAGALAGILVASVAAPKPATVVVPVELTANASSVPVRNTVAERTLLDRVRAARAAISDRTIALTETVERRVTPAAARIALIGWGCVSAVLFLLFALVNRQLAIARRGWPSRSLHGTTVRVSPRLGPAVLGFLRAEIVVPRSLLERSDDEQRLILAHEREHLCTRDHLMLGAAWFGAIVFPWHPAVWYLTNRVRLAIELDCDARVLRGGASPRSYGALLIDMAARQSAARIGALALADGPSHLERRILAMKAGKRRYALARGTALAAVGGLLVLAACEAKIPTTAEVAQMDVAGAQRAAAKSGLVRTASGDRTDFFLNGVRATAQEVSALEGEQIASLTMVKSELSTGRDTVFVVTKDRVTDESGKPRGAEPAERYRYRTWKAVPDSEPLAQHIVREHERVRVPGASSAPETRAMQPMKRTTSGGRDDQAIITIDGKVATEAQLAALDERDIASMSVYKGKLALLQLESNKSAQLEVKSNLKARLEAKEAEALIAVTTKMGRQAQSTRP